MERSDGKRLQIMKILSEEESPLSSQVITERLKDHGMVMSERTVRFHLLALDKSGFTEYKEKKGRYLTPSGMKELSRNQVYDKVGFLSARIDELSYKMSFNYKKKVGTVPINVSLIPLENSSVVSHQVAPIFKSGLTMGNRVVLLKAGEKVGDLEVPPGYFGLGTVCSFTLNGVLLNSGIPINSLFGGLLSISGNRADHFEAIINYNGTSLDPLEIFINSGMTNVRGAAEGGYGCIGASFREFPALALDEVLKIHDKLEVLGLGCILKSGYTGHALLGVPVADNRVGIITAGGLNGIAPLVESGVPVQTKALTGLIDYERLIPFTELYESLAELHSSS